MLCATLHQAPNSISCIDLTSGMAVPMICLPSIQVEDLNIERSCTWMLYCISGTTLIIKVNRMRRLLLIDRPFHIDLNIISSIKLNGKRTLKKCVFLATKYVYTFQIVTKGYCSTCHAALLATFFSENPKRLGMVIGIRVLDRKIPHLNFNCSRKTAQ